LLPPIPRLESYGPVARDRVHEFCHEADVVVLPTIFDGFALTHFEAVHTPASEPLRLVNLEALKRNIRA
jgi:hypothetical protein